MKNLLQEGKVLQNERFKLQVDCIGRTDMRDLKENNKKYYWIALVCVVLGILYWVLPIDLLPDFITGIGWVDDLIFGLTGFIGGMVNFFIGLGLGVKLTKSAEEKLRWEGEFEQTYGPMYGTFTELH